MKRRSVQIAVSDHAVVRWLERAHGLDVAAVKAAIAGKVMNGAELQAVAVVVDGVRYVLREAVQPTSALPLIIVPTVLLADQRWRGDD